MGNFIYKFQEFMRGRYGFDELNGTLLVSAIFLSLISRFVFSFWPRVILELISLVFFALAIFRFLSRNCYQRGKENDIYKPIFVKVRDFFTLTYKRFRDGKTHRYYKCPSCKAQLRVKNIKGEHTIRCPKCGYKFKKKIR